METALAGTAAAVAGHILLERHGCHLLSGGSSRPAANGAPRRGSSAANGGPRRRALRELRPDVVGSQTTLEGGRSHDLGRSPGSSSEKACRLLQGFPLRQ